MPERPSISLCMIVRDAEHDLARCLASVRGVADEMVIVDTGSRDRTREVARAHGARLLETPWQDDFAAARNVGLDAATGEWILFLDADEVLDPPRPMGLRDLARSAEHAGYYLSVSSPTAGDDTMDVAILRMFRASPRVRFRYPIHEQVLEDLVDWARRDGLRFSLIEDVRILHDGYRPEVVRLRDKTQRNHRLFQKALRLHPQNAYLWYKWADALRSEPGRGGEALAAAERALQILERKSGAELACVPFFPEALAVCAAARLAEGRLEDARAQVLRHSPQQWRSANYSYVAAHVHEAAGELDTALHFARDAKAVQSSVLLVQRPGVRGPLGAALRARLHLRRGEWQAAEEEARAAVQFDPGLDAGHRIWADSRLARGDVDGALNILTRAIRQSRSVSGLCSQLALLLLRLERPAQAAPLLRRAAKVDPLARVALALFFCQREHPLAALEEEDLAVLEAWTGVGEPPRSDQRPVRRLLAPLLRSSRCMA